MNLHYDKDRYRLQIPNADDKFSLPWIDPFSAFIHIKEDHEKMIKNRENANKKREERINQLKESGAHIPKSLTYSPITTLDDGYTSLREYYKKWLPHLGEEKIVSNDLLDQILVCFTIKRALNQDEEAIDKLCSLYEDTAIGIAYKMTKARKLMGQVDDIKQDAGILLRQVIAGLGHRKLFTA